MGSVSKYKHNQSEQSEPPNYFFIILSALLISGSLTAAAIKLFQSDEAKAMQVYTLVYPQVSPVAEARPINVVIAETVVQPLATDAMTPYQAQLREEAVLNAKVSPQLSGNISKSDSNGDSVPEEISRKKAESRMAERRATKNKPEAAAALRKRVLLAKVAAPDAPSFVLKPAEAASVAEGVDKPIPTESPATGKSLESVPVASIDPAQANTALPAVNKSPEKVPPPATGKSLESVSVASIDPAQANTVLPGANKSPEKVSPPATEKKNSDPYLSLHSPSVSPSPADSEMKTTVEDTEQYAAAADISKKDATQQDDKKEDKTDKKDKGPSFMTILEWTIKIAGIALVLLK